MSEPTPNHGYNRLEEGDQNWGGALNENIDAFEIDIELRDSGPPEEDDYAAAPGTKYLDTGMGRVYIGDSNNEWQLLGSLDGDGGGDGTVLEAGRYLGDEIGERNFVGAAEWENTGYEGNDAPGNDAVVGGGTDNTAAGEGTTVGGGHANAATDPRATVGGGENNDGVDTYVTVAGGSNNRAGDADDDSRGFAATVGGGTENESTGTRATIAGGDRNEASGSRATVAGG